MLGLGVTEFQGGDGETGFEPLAVPRTGHPHGQLGWEHEAQINRLGVTEEGEVRTSIF